MKEAYYFHDDTVIMNYSMVYYRKTSELIGSDPLPAVSGKGSLRAV